MIIVSDTSPISYLVLIGRQDILLLLFGEVIIPESVQRELQHAGAPPAVCQWIANHPAWLKVRSSSTPPDATLSHLDEGEREAIRLAEELKADLLVIDERAGREEALKRNLRIIGTLGILEHAAERGMLDFALSLIQLKANGFFVSRALELNFLARDAIRKARPDQPP